MTILPASAARLGQASAVAAASSVGYRPPSRSAGRNTAPVPAFAAMYASSSSGPMPRLLAKPAFSSSFTYTGPALGCADSHHLMSDRQASRFWLRLPVYRVAALDA